MSKCDNCEIKKWYARVVDYHIFDERDCPYICKKEEPKETETMNKKKTEEKLKNLEGMKGAIEGIVSQAWERGYKYGLFEAEQKKQVKVLIGGEQVYPNPNDKPLPC